MSRAEEIAAKAARLRGLSTSVPTDLITSVPAEPLQVPAWYTDTAMPADGHDEYGTIPLPGTEVSTSVRTDLSTSVPAGARARPPRTRPVRLTLDVSPAEHAALRRLCGELAIELGVAQVSGQAVLRSLIRRVLVDEAARAQLERDLETQ